jgi:hypothetical protein
MDNIVLTADMPHDAGLQTHKDWLRSPVARIHDEPIQVGEDQDRYRPVSFVSQKQSKKKKRKRRSKRLQKAKVRRCKDIQEVYDGSRDRGRGAARRTKIEQEGQTTEGQRKQESKKERPDKQKEMSCRWSKTLMEYKRSMSDIRDKLFKFVKSLS